MRSLTRIISVSAISALALGATATAAFAADPPPSSVQANATIGLSLSVTGISPTVEFGSVIPGSASIVPNAQQIHVTDNNPAGASISIAPANGGFKKGPGQPDLFGNSAVSITTSTQGKVQLSDNPGSILLDQVAAGDHTYSETWALTVPSSLVDSGNVFAVFNLTFQSN